MKNRRRLYTYDQTSVILEKLSENADKFSWIKDCELSRQYSLRIRTTKEQYGGSYRWYRLCIEDINTYGPLPLP